jgi:hypothetical protein
MKRFVWGAIVLAVFASTDVRAQNSSIDDLKGKIFDADMTTKTFAKGAKFCKDLDGKTNFYFTQRDRVLNLEEYHRSLENLAREQIFNAETKRPWNEQDANLRWQQAQKEAAQDKVNCDLIASLPELQKQLQELQSKSSNTKN